MRIIIRRDDEIEIEDFVKLKIKKKEAIYEICGYNTLQLWQEKRIQIDNLEKIIIYSKDSYKELFSKTDLQEFLSYIKGNEESICFKYKNKS